MPALDAHWSPVQNAPHKFFVYSAFYDDRVGKIVRVIAATLRENSTKEVRVNDREKNIHDFFLHIILFHVTMTKKKDEREGFFLKKQRIFFSILVNTHHGTLGTL